MSLKKVLDIAMCPLETTECLRCVIDTIEPKAIPAKLYRTIYIGNGVRMLWYLPLNTEKIAKNHGVLVLRGGLQHSTDITDTPYIRRLYGSLPNSHLFMLAREEPFIDVSLDLQIINDAVMAINHWMDYDIRLDMVGCSMGGIFLLKYLLEGGDCAEEYYIMSSPLDLHNLDRRIGMSPSFNLFFDWLLGQYDVTDMRGLFGKYGRNYEEFLKVCGTLYKDIKELSPNWLQKRVTFVYGSHDRLLADNTYREDLKNGPIRSIEVSSGYHCSADVIYAIAREIRRKHGGIYSQA